MLVIISGCSGVGKNTIINEIIDRYDGFELLPTYTTRAIRVNETEGYPYYFVSVEDFERMAGEDEFYEHQIVHGNYYGVSRKVLQSKMELQKTLIKDVDVLGTQALVDQIRSTIRVLTFFYFVDSKSTLVERLKLRGEKNIETRLERYDLEMQQAGSYDYIIDNIDMESTILLTKSIIDFEAGNKLLRPLKSEANVDESKKRVIKEEMTRGVVFPPVDVVVEDGEVYIADGYHRYLAAVETGTQIAKNVLAPERAD